MDIENQVMQLQNGMFKVDIRRFRGIVRTGDCLISLQLSTVQLGGDVETVTMGIDQAEALIRLLQRSVARAHELENCSGKKMP